MKMRNSKKSNSKATPQKAIYISYKEIFEAFYKEKMFRVVQPSSSDKKYSGNKLTCQ